MAVPLNYQGRPGTEDMSAFNARTNITWKGDMLFRVYPHEGKLYFIKVGGSKNNQAAIHFGLIGAVVNHFAQKRSAKKTQETLGAIRKAGSALAVEETIVPLSEVDRIVEMESLRSAETHFGGLPQPATA